MLQEQRQRKPFLLTFGTLPHILYLPHVDRLNIIANQNSIYFLFIVDDYWSFIDLQILYHGIVKGDIVSLRITLMLPIYYGGEV